MTYTLNSGVKTVCVYIYIYIYRQHFFINTNFVKHNRYFLCTYFLLDPFVFPYCFYRIRRELIYVLCIVVYIPSTFCPTLGHHQGRRKYQDRKCLRCLTKFVFIKKCCQNIHILNSMILLLINISALWNTDGIAWRDKLLSVSKRYTL